MNQLTWELVPENSYLQFKVKFLRISQVTGSFERFSCRIRADPEFTSADITALVDAGSVRTFYEDWDEKMLSPAFFATETWPQFTFRATAGCRISGGNIHELDGRLTIRDIAREITLIVSFAEVRMNRKRPTAVFHLFTTIRRSEFGLTVPNEDEIDDEVSLYAVIALTGSG